MKTLLQTLIATALLTPMLAWPQGNAALPEPLQGMPRAGESCKSDAPTARVTAQGAPAQPSLACMAPAGAVQASVAGGTLTVVDARLEPEFQRFHIPGALNVLPGSLLHRPALRAKPLLLVGDGKNARELYAACARLRQAGFTSVRVLAGGMVSWVADGLPLRGRAPLAHELAALDAAQLWAEGQYADNLVVVAGKAAGYTDHLPYAVALDSLSPASLAALVQQRRKEAGALPAAVVLVWAQAMTDETYRPLAAAVAPSGLLVYAGTPASLSQFVASQKAVWAAQARGPKQPRCG
ncbi:MAG: rhodanese-like domain-containing protein [Ramlibacter sp.]